VLWEIGWRCSGGLRPCSSRSSTVPTLDRDEDDGVALGSGHFGKLFPLAAASTSPLLPLLPLLSWLGCAVDGHTVAAGHRRALGHPRLGFYNRAPCSHGSR